MLLAELRGQRHVRHAVERADAVGGEILVEAREQADARHHLDDDPPLDEVLIDRERNEARRRARGVA